jgi:hypothetical protein
MFFVRFPSSQTPLSVAPVKGVGRVRIPINRKRTKMNKKKPGPSPSLSLWSFVGSLRVGAWVAEGYETIPAESPGGFTMTRNTVSSFLIIASRFADDLPRRKYSLIILAHLLTVLTLLSGSIAFSQHANVLAPTTNVVAHQKCYGAEL